MQGLHQLEIVILLLTVVLILTTVAQRSVIPYPILLVIAGVGLALVPGLPVIRLDPDLVFLVFLPPILWSAAYFTSFREFRQNLRPIALLAIGLVAATTAAVAMVARIVLPGMAWPEAIALGAIVSPPDAVAATAIARRLRIPRRIITILEGESLVNDATALIIYRGAILAAVSGQFTPGEMLLQFIGAAVGGVLIGLVIGGMSRWVLSRTGDTFTEVTITLLAPYVAWVLAENIHASGVLSCVAGGLYLRRHFSAIVSPATRIQGRGVWNVLIFILNGTIFILLGLQFGALRQAVPAGQFGHVMFAGVIISLIVIAVRLVWVPLAAWIPRAISRSLRVRDPMPPWSALFITGWGGMRGIVTLAAALALPHIGPVGAPFPYRAEIILISFSVILATLVFQGLSLVPIIRMLKLEDDRVMEQEEMKARAHGAAAALKRLTELDGEGSAKTDQLRRLQEHYGRRLQRFSAPGEVDPECTNEAAKAFRELRRETLEAERRALIGLRNDGTISDEVLHRLEHELDVDALRLGFHERGE